jgi:hypothetical protein
MTAASRIIKIRKGENAWLVQHPDFPIELPLPLTPAATREQALAHTRALPLAVGFEVQVA